MTNKSPSGATKHCESTKPESCQMAKIHFDFLLFLLPFLSSDVLVQNFCVNLSQWFLHKTAAFYSDQYITPLLFHNFKASQDT